MRLRRKISVAFFLVSSLVSLLLAVFLYRFVDRQLRSELKARLRDIAHIGAQAIDLSAYQRLRAAAVPDVPPDRVATFEQSPDYRRIYDQLNAIRDTEPDLIRYAYILIPTGDPSSARFVVDADVLKGSIDGEDVSHFAQAYDMGKLPLLRQALAECKALVEEDFVHDDTFNVDSVSGYFPIGVHDGTCDGVLGLDITDKNMQAAMSAAGNLAIKISLAVIALALLVSIAMGTVLTRSILSLSTTVTRFANKDFGARTQIGSRDEIGKLGNDFNAMAETIQQHSDNLEHLVEVRTSELTAEKENSERLLLNVLPAPIAERLKHSSGVIVDRFEAVTVLFADLVGFTALSSRTSPEALVGMLDDLFSIFDRLAEELGLEKIKTIGDAYMVVAGIPEPRADHALAMARMGLAMQAELRNYAAQHATDLTIRVGIHTGSVVAGVIGRKKFIYDLWGDTVNTASRMESHGIPGRVHISEVTYLLLREDLACEPRGTVDIKGKGPMATYVVVDAAAPPMAETAAP